MFNLDDCVALITSRSAKVFAQALEKTLKPYNVTRTQWIAMYYIYNSKCITQKKLADKMALREPTVARLLQKMELEGYICKHGSDYDKRIRCLRLSPKGEKVCFELMPVFEKFKNITVSGIDKEDLQVLKNVLDKMQENALKL